MRELEIPEWVARVGAEVRDRTDQLPVNEPYLLDVTELLRSINDRELAERRRRSGRGILLNRTPGRQQRCAPPPGAEPIHPVSTDGQRARPVLAKQLAPFMRVRLMLSLSVVG